MNLRQLRYVLEVYRQGNHISAAAIALHTSQPGISKQIQLLEDELGFEIFSRKRNRIVNITQPGREVITIAQRLLADTDSLRKLGEDITARTSGSLTLATSHAQARYVLPKVIERFIKLHPNVRLSLRQGNQKQVVEYVDSGLADIGIGTEVTENYPNLVRLPCLSLPRAIITKVGHPLMKVKKLTLQEIARYPLITQDPDYSGRWKVLEAFKNVGIEPNVIFYASDADVSKTYVELGLGITILAMITFDRVHDRGLRARDASHLFAPSTTYITLRANDYLRRYTYDFIKSLAPALTAEIIQSAQKAAAR